MIIVTNTSKIKKGEAHKLVERFDKVGKIEYMKGFEGLEVLLSKNDAEHDEVTISTRWRSEHDFKNWVKSDAFKEAHSHGKNKPDFIIKNKINMYQVEIVREPIVSV